MWDKEREVKEVIQLMFPAFLTSSLSVMVKVSGFLNSVQDLQYTDYSLHFQSGSLEFEVYGFKISVVQGFGLRVHGLGI